MRSGLDGSVSLPRGEEHMRRPRASRDPVSACHKGKVLGGAGECSSEEGTAKETGEGHWVVSPKIETVGLNPVGNGSQEKPESRAVSRLSMTADLWESFPQYFALFSTPSLTGSVLFSSLKK